MPFLPEQRQRLLELIDQRCLMTGGEMTLSTGAKSTFYFDCKRATLHGESLALLADAFLEEIRKLPEQPQAIGGLTLGADPITAAVVLAAHQQGWALEGSIARKEPKKHGTRTPIENDLPHGTRIVVVDDVVTSGSSTLQAAEKFQAAGYKIVGVVALVDREAGGMAALVEKIGCPISAVFRKSDFPRLAQGVAHEPAQQRVAA